MFVYLKLFSSLRSVIDKPPIVGKELLPLTSVQLAGFRLHPGPVSKPNKNKPQKYKVEIDHKSNINLPFELQISVTWAIPLCKPSSTEEAQKQTQKAQAQAWRNFKRTRSHDDEHRWTRHPREETQETKTIRPRREGSTQKTQEGEEEEKAETQSRAFRWTDALATLKFVISRVCVSRVRNAKPRRERLVLRKQNSRAELSADWKPTRNQKLAECEVVSMLRLFVFK